ncbi:MAG TPA: DMT family transporter [Phycisphaerae bacterium]|nr:DMT family transporter [Phycisphaerae bacterium]
MLGDFDRFVGPAAGITTSLLWTGTSLCFTAAGKRIGPTMVNGTRIALAIVLLGLTHRFMAGTWIPTASIGQVTFLAFSGIVGLAIGDQALFTAFVSIGPRLAMLIMATAPIFAAFFGWLALGETLPDVAWIGIALTIGGVGWVVFERQHDGSVVRNPHRLLGVLFAFVAAACQAGGLLLSKQGMGHGWLPEDQHMTPQAATFVRMVFAGLGVLPIVLLHARRQRKRRAAGIRPFPPEARRAGLILAACGAVVGPYLGVWMSLVAADRAAMGVAQTLMSLTPVFILPFAVLVHKERISPRAVIGALIAVGGSALLFFNA